MSNRRMGPPDSASFNALLDAAERVIVNEGYAAVSSRRVAEEAGLKQQLVYYYFRSMDDVLISMFKRRTSRALALLEEEVASERPIQAIWQTWCATTDTKMAFEIMALANHHEGIRAEVAKFVTKFRQAQSQAIARQYQDLGLGPTPVTPKAAVFLLYCVSLMLVREEAVGITECHEEVRELVDWALRHVS